VLLEWKQMFESEAEIIISCLLIDEDEKQEEA
jgi:hypothetical protein